MITTAQKVKFSIEVLFSKCDQPRRKLWIWPYLLKKPLMEDIICAVYLEKEEKELPSLSLF